METPQALAAPLSPIRLGGNLFDIDPELRPLASQGGPTMTHPVFPGTPAHNAGDPEFASPPAYDQRGPGFPRVMDGRINIGAVESLGDTIHADRFEQKNQADNG